MVEEGHVMALDYGSTSQVLAQALAARFQRLTVVTNSIQNALLLADKPGFTVILTGGVLSRDEHTLVNDFPTGILDYVHVDILFLTVTGIDPMAGFTDQRPGKSGAHLPHPRGGGHHHRRRGEPGAGRRGGKLRCTAHSDVSGPALHNALF